MEEHYFFLQVRTIISICELHYYFLLGITLIKLRTIIGLPYLWARSSKWNFVAWYVGSYLCTGSQNRGSKRSKGKCYNSVQFNNEQININPNCILTNYVRLRAKSWCFLWPEKWYWSTHLHNWTHFALAGASFFVKDNLLCLNIISNSPSIIHSPFQVTT